MPSSLIKGNQRQPGQGQVNFRRRITSQTKRRKSVLPAIQLVSNLSSALDLESDELIDLGGKVLE